MKRRRDGFGLIVALALFLVLVAGTASWSLGARGSQVSVEVRAGHDITGARLSAQAALEEVSFALATQSNDPGSPLFSLFRDKILSGAPVEIPVPAEWLTQHQQHVAAACPNTRLTGVTAAVRTMRGYRGSQRPWLTDVYGTVALTARVQVMRGSTAATEIVSERWLEFKVVRPSLGPPFSQFPLTLVNPSAWANAHARYEVSSDAERTDALVVQMLADLTTAERQAQKLEQVIPEVEKNFAEAAAKLKAWISDINRILKASEPLRRWWERGPPADDLRYLRSPHLRYILSGDVDGEAVNLPARLLDQARPRLDQRERWDRARRVVQEKLDIQDIGGVMAAFDTLRTESIALLELDVKLLQEVRTVQELFVRRVGSGEVDRLFGPYLTALRTGHDTTYQPGGGSFLVQAGRVTHAVTAPGARQQLIDLFERSGSPFCGLIDVRNPGEELVLSEADRWLTRSSGRVVLIVRGDVDLSDLKMAASGSGPPSALLTIVCHGRLRAKGQVDAALVALDRFEPTGPLAVRGPMLLMGSVFEGDIEPEKVLAGLKLIEDKRYSTLESLDAGRVLPGTLRVLFGPHPVMETSVREAPRGER